MTKEKKTWAGVEIVENHSNNLIEQINMLEERIDKLERLLRLATGPCGTCSGSGIEMVGCATEGRQVPEPCSYCHGSGKQPLDVASMMEQFKEQARREVFSEDIPF